MMYNIYFEKNDTWHFLQTIKATSKEDAYKKARQSNELSKYYGEEELEFVNIEVELSQEGDSQV